MKIRVGFGFDVHRLVEGRELWLGGIRLEHELGLLGHSDADVLIHAICDALLGAANMRDIGYHFPDTAGEFKNIDSKILLARTVDLIAEKGWRVGNIDATVCAERPKLSDTPYSYNTENGTYRKGKSPEPHSGRDLTQHAAFRSAPCSGTDSLNSSGRSVFFNQYRGVC